MPEAGPPPGSNDTLGADPTQGATTEDDTVHGAHDGIDHTGDGGDTHRGGFGEFGGDGPGLIDRAFRERIVLVGVTRPDRGSSATEASLDELSLLVDTAGADAIERVCQRRAAPDAATFVGAGKAREIRAIAEEVDSDTVVFDDELSPAQQFNLEKLLGRTALDRTAVILDIFAQERQHTGGQGPGRVGPTPLPASPPAGRGEAAVAAGGRDRHPRPRRDPARSGPAPPGASHTTSSRMTFAASPATAAPSPRPAAAPATGRWRSSATPTRASRRCSTG